ncbi:type II toxin-antitoxin system RelE/ParE family toxin [Pseudoxanthobacter sp. M-2]|uniref:type II toxin-antitoxin system RelE/ParE family toxin n=1 Tax=Pseudoxanthobacter sp. M-2 TaxID=3078754 RepID=UPI0038FC69A4
MRVVWTRGALADVDQIQDFVAQDRPIAAHQLAIALIGRTNALLADNPFACRRGRAVGTRELVVTGTPYIVIFRVRDIVEVLAVVHGAHKPRDEL